jgi:hypothetical protein
MMLLIEEHVHDRIANGSRVAERTHVIAFREHPSVTSEHPIHATRDAHRKALNAARQCSVVGCFYDDMDVIALDRDVADPKSFFVRLRDGGAERELAPPYRR